jgi:hypothetical protein
MQQHHSIYGKTFQDRLVEDARRLREEASKIPDGTARNLLLQQAFGAETAVNVDRWLSARQATKMTNHKSKVPIILHAADVLRRARALPAGAARNDLRQLARGLRDLHREAST